MKANRWFSNCTLYGLIWVFGGVPKGECQELTQSKIEVQALYTGMSLEEALTRLVVDQKVPLSFDPAILPLKSIQFSAAKIPITDLLDTLLKGTALTYQWIYHQFVITRQLPTSYTLSGHIQDGESGELLIGAIASIDGGQSMLLSNNYGYYVFTLAKGSHSLRLEHLGYKPQTILFTLGTSKTLDIGLTRNLEVMREVKIQDRKDDLLEVSRNSHEKPLDQTQFRKLPYYGGQQDLIKALQMQGGIKGVSEGGGSLFIRGGNKDQNLFLLDEAVVYNPTHLFGLVSVFNSDALKNVSLYDAYIPANYGGRLSSVIDARTMDGDQQTFHVKGGLSLFSARVSLEGPLFQRLTLTHPHSFFLSFRTGELNPFNNNIQLSNVRASFYDLNLKLTATLNKNNRVFATGYTGYDNLTSLNANQNSWGNQAASIRWNHLFNSKLFFNLTATYSYYQNIIDITQLDSVDKPKWKTSIQDLGFKGDFIYYLNSSNQLKFGVGRLIHWFTPGETVAINLGYNIPRSKAAENSAYVQYEMPINGHIHLTWGLRATLFQNIAVDKLFILDTNYVAKAQVNDLSNVFNTYFNVEPRVGLSYPINASNEIHFSYSSTYQYLQLLQNDELAFSSLETWLPSSPQLKPQKADIESLGFRSLHTGFTLRADVYFKQLYHQLDLVDHSQLILNPIVENQLRAGTSTAYGVEIGLDKTIGRLKASLDYTWSRVFRQIRGINNNQTYPANYDIPHDLKFTCAYQLSPRITLTTFFTFTSGRTVSLPTGYYVQNNGLIPIYENRNGSRFPNVHRLDLNVSIDPVNRPDRPHRFTSLWTIGIYNVYNQKNPLYVGIAQDPASPKFSYLRYFSGFAPNVSYTFRF